MQRRLVQHRWNSQKMKDLVVTAWRMIQNRTILTEPRLLRSYVACAMLQKHGPYHGMLGDTDRGRSRFDRTWADEDSFKATAETEKDGGKLAPVQRLFGSEAATASSPSSSRIRQAHRQRLRRRPVQPQATPSVIRRQRQTRQCHGLSL